MAAIHSNLDAAPGGLGSDRLLARRFVSMAWANFSGRPSVFYGLVSIGIVASFFGIFAPYLQKLFVDALWASSGHTLSQNMSLFGYIFGSFICLVAAQGCGWLIRYFAAQESIRIQEVLSSAVYRHTLNLHHGARAKLSVGDTVTYYAQDVSAAGSLIEECLSNFISSLIPLVMAPLSIGFVFGAKLSHVFLVALLGLIICFLFGIRQARLFVQYKEVTQERLSVVNEWLQNLKLLRISGRVLEFEEKINKVRVRETKSRMDMVTNASMMNAFSQVLPQAINIVGLVSLISVRGNALTPGDIFGLLWIFGVFLNMPIRQLPWGLVNAVDGFSSLKRIHEFLSLPVAYTQVSEHEALKNEEHLPISVPSGNRNSVHASVFPGINLSGLKVRNLGGRVILAVDHFECSKGEVVAIVGEVGAGKSLFLSALYGEMQPEVSSYFIENHPLHSEPRSSWKRFFTVVPQNGFVMNANLRRNVGLEYDAQMGSDEKLLEGLRLADFDPLTERLGAGLDTSLGERGVNLSGGQRQRLSLARATQFNRPIVLLDDSLSAVDVSTELNLVNELIMGFWKDKTRIIVTHRLTLLKYVSRVLFLHEGRAIDYGSFSELLERCDAFRKFVESYTREENLRLLE